MDKLAALRLPLVRSVRPSNIATPVHSPAATVPAFSPKPILIKASPVNSPDIEFVASPLISRETKETAMAALRAEALACLKCPQLAAARKNVVFGVGDIHSPLMFVGEAPGADEDQQGEPFVGAAGQLLTKMIQTMGFTRQSVYIANILKCRPDTPGQSFGNRKPTPEEMRTCLPYLLRQIELIRPRVIVALGATAVEGLFGKTVGITRLRGTWHEFQNTPVMPTYHPSYLLRTQSLTDKRKVWEDLLAVLEKLGCPISEKQRGYFLRGTS
ncbi:MAG: uracil-DNA glycosylase [Verrucomicrobia bacterium]|nr:uracil-DNA glycosylase [Verrucomicrobiota bacterium]